MNSSTKILRNLVIAASLVLTAAALGSGATPPTLREFKLQAGLPQFWDPR